MTSIGIIGSKGRMGQALVVAAEEASGSRRLSDHDGILVEIGRAAPVPYEP